MTMSPVKRSIEYKLPKVRHFVNAQKLSKFAQFDASFIKAGWRKKLPVKLPDQGLRSIRLTIFVPDWIVAEGSNEFSVAEAILFA